MGRGLSDLQKTILALALEHRQAGIVEPDCYKHEVLERHYGWKTIKLPGARRSGAGWHFSKKDIGAKEYDSVMVALKKAAKRLQKRGLIEIGGGLFTKQTWYDLTHRGLLVAERLTKKVPT